MNPINKFIIKKLKENKKEVIIISLIATIGSVLSVATPYIYGKLFDLAIIPNTALTFLFSLIFIWLVASLISNYASNKAGYRGGILGVKIAWTEEAERIVQNGIKKLIKNRTTIIIAHRFSTVKHADKIIVLDKGKIIEKGNHQELMKKKGKYYHLYNLQIGLE